MATAYEDDGFAWAFEQAALLRAGKLSEVDAENIAEELESFAKRERRALTEGLTILLTFMLKEQLKVDRDRAWLGTLSYQRSAINFVLRDNPSLRANLVSFTEAAYARARDRAAIEMDLSVTGIPEACPWSMEDILNI